MNRGWYIFENSSGNYATIYLYGDIFSWSDFSAKKFLDDFNLLASVYPLIKVRINSRGGGVFEGLAIYNIIKTATVEVHCFIDGEASSIAALIFLAGRKRYAAQVSMLMLHPVQGYACGDASQLRQAADVADKLTNLLSDELIRITGKTKEEVATWMGYGVESWFTPEEMITAGLIDEIVDPVATNTRLPEKKDKANVDMFLNSMNTELTQKFSALMAAHKPNTKIDENNSDMEQLKKLALQLGMTNFENLSEKGLAEAIETKIKSLGDENTRLKTEADAQMTNMKKEIISAAISAGKITEKQRESFENIAQSSSVDAMRKMFDGMEAVKDLTNLKRDEKKGEDGEDRSKWGYDEWSKKDPKGLAEMQNSRPDEYEKIFEAKFKRKPKR